MAVSPQLHNCVKDLLAITPILDARLHYIPSLFPAVNQWRVFPGSTIPLVSERRVMEMSFPRWVIGMLNGGGMARSGRELAD